MWSGCIDSITGLNKRKKPVKYKAPAGLRRPARNEPLRLFVSREIAVDQTGDIVIILFLFLEESIVVLFDLDLDVIIDDSRDLVVGGIGFIQRDELDVGFSVGLFFRRCADTLAPGQSELEDRPAFRADDRVLVQIEKFRAALLALMLIAELGFRHRLDP
jgi:hypothetical protein